MKQLFLLFSTLFLYPQLYGQNYYGLSGNLTDEHGTELLGATILLLNLPDSTMEEYALTNEKGFFKLSAPKQTNYLLRISYMGYEDYEQVLDLNQKIDLGTIVLKEKTALLESVEVVEERIPIRMKGDTLEYSAGAFEIQEHDNVEALLKKLPGIQVDRDGTLKAQGERVDRILVDGKEFFGDNPEVAMKNLPAGVVDKVQVYDRKSDMAEFSGVEDGLEKKTLNLTLKEDKKHGFFGHVEGAYGYAVPDQFEASSKNHRYLGNLSLNYFNPKIRLSTIGAINNINEQSFNFMDYINLMGGLQSMMSGGNINLEINEGDPLGALLKNNQEGIAQTIGGGVNFNWFISDKTEWNTHYFYSIINKEKETRNFTRSIGLNQFFIRNAWLNSKVQAGNHNLNSTFKQEFDPTQDLKLELRFKWNDAFSIRDNIEQSLGVTNELQNEIHQNYTQKQQAWGLNSNLLYRKKFQKKGRVFMSNLVFGYSKEDKNNTNVSTTNLYNNAGNLQVVDSLNQEQFALENQQVYGTEISFIEPLGKKNFLEIKLVGMLNLHSKDQQVYDVENGSNSINDRLTNLFQKEYNYQTATARFQHSQKPYTLTLEASLQRSFLKGIFSDGQPSLARTYYYPLGAAALDYKISRSSSFNFRYQTRIKEPKIQELQAIVNNNNPIELYVGNPNLNPEYHHELGLRYNLFDQFSFTSFFARASFMLFQNQIVENQTIDDNLRVSYQPENAGIGYQANLYLDFSRPIKVLGIKFNLGLNGTLSQRTTQINKVTNEELTQRYTFKASIENRKKKIIDALIGTRIDFNKSTFSINNSLNTGYLNYVAYTEIKVILAKKWNLNSSFDYEIYADPTFSENIYIPMWSAGLSRTFLKANQLKIELRVFNLLDQQLSIQRTNQNNLILESRVNTLGRYFMLSARYKITQVGAKNPNAGLNILMN